MQNYEFRLLFSRWLKFSRIDRKYSLVEFADRVGELPLLVSDWEHNQKIPDVWHFYKILPILGTCQLFPELSYNDKEVSIMPRIKKDDNRFRFWVGLDNQPELAEQIIDWSVRAGFDNPSDFIKMCVKLYGSALADRLQISDKFANSQNNQNS
jgi:transcriptional regulator with XRE-family HTH domain